MAASEEERRGPIIRDRRRIDPVTGQARRPAQSASADAGHASGKGQARREPGQARPGKHAVSKPGSSRTEASGGGQPAGPAAPDSGAADSDRQEDSAAVAAAARADELAGTLAERTADLQRVQAEYANYRKRVDRDRTAVRELALASVLVELLPVLDDIGRARDHDELTGGFKAVADSFESAVGKLGLTTFGKAGEAFDPNVHEALMHAYSAEVTEPTCVQVLQPGYKVGERILRPARVAVAEPTDPAGARTASEDTPPAGEDTADEDTDETTAEASAADDDAGAEGD